MKSNKRLKDSLIWLIRWIAYVPCILIVITVWKYLTEGYLSGLPWWMAMPIWGFFGPALCISSVFGTGLICPNRKVGNFLILGLFLIPEIVDFYNEFGISTALENIIRGWSDGCIVIGLFLSAISKVDSKN